MDYKRESNENLPAAFMAGVMVGMVAGLLLAPRAGAEMRASLKEYAVDAIDDILEAALRTGRTYVESIVERGKEYIDATVKEVLEPVKNIQQLR